VAGSSPTRGASIGTTREGSESRFGRSPGSCGGGSVLVTGRYSNRQITQIAEQLFDVTLDSARTTD